MDKIAASVREHYGCEVDVYKKGKKHEHDDIANQVKKDIQREDGFL